MAINFDNLNPSAPQPTEATPTAGVTLNLEKNMVLDLSKAAPDIRNATLGAGWDVSQMGSDADLDIFSILLDENGKISAVGDVIFYNNRSLNGLTLSGDNRTGAGEGDDEQIFIDLGSVPDRIKRIVTGVSIFDAVARRQTFGMIDNAYIRLVNKDTDQELARFNLNGDYSTDTTVIFAELVRSGNDWAFHTIGEGKQADLNTIIGLYQ
jgi:tellurium resistance protein TerD